MITIWLAALAVIGIVGLAVDIIEHAWLTALIAPAAVTAAYVLGRRHGARRRGLRVPRRMPVLAAAADCEDCQTTGGCRCNEGNR